MEFIQFFIESDVEELEPVDGFRSYKKIVNSFSVDLKLKLKYLTSEQVEELYALVASFSNNLKNE